MISQNGVTPGETGIQEFYKHLKEPDSGARARLESGFDGREKKGIWGLFKKSLRYQNEKNKMSKFLPWIPT